MATKTKAQFEDIDQILAAFGNIPGQRIKTLPPPGTATEDDWLRLEGRGKCLCELVDGTLVEKAMGAGEAFLAIELAFWLRSDLQQNSLGMVFGADGAARLMPGLIRIPDLSFVRRERFPVVGKVPRVPVLDLAPDLAVEVLSESNTPEEMRRKRKDYFTSGVLRVWFIDPATRTARVYTDPETNRTLQETDTLTDEAILPGFALPLAQLFANLEETRATPKPKKPRTAKPKKRRKK